MTRISAYTVAASAACLMAAATMVVVPVVHAQEKLSMATPDTCKFPFFHRNTWWNTCTDIGNNGTMWCILKDEVKPKPPANDWLSCDMSKFGAPSALIDGQLKPCVPRSGDSGMFSGCNGATEKGPFTCLTASGSGTCSTTKNQLGGGKGNDNVMQNGKDASAAQGVTAAGASTLPVGAVVGIVASVASVALLAGLFVYRRRQSSQDPSWNYQGKGMETGETPAAGAGFSSAAAAAAASGYRGSTVSSQMFSPVSPDERLYPVVSTYSPTLGDELEIQPGDKISVLIEYDDGWCQGINHTRGGLKGVFPRHCVDMTAGIPLDDSTRPTSLASSSAPNLSG